MSLLPLLFSFFVLPLNNAVNSGTLCKSKAFTQFWKVQFADVEYLFETVISICKTAIPEGALCILCQIKVATHNFLHFLLHIH